ncbi:MAG: dipeptide epimerase [Pseudomonadota bacterium]
MKLTVSVDKFALHEPFTISNFEWTTADVCTVELEVDGVIGRGEGVPIFYHGERPEDVAAEVEAIRPQIEKSVDRDQAAELLPAGAALCALDGALWDLEARTSGQPVHVLAGLVPPEPIDSAITITLKSVDEMRERAIKYRDYPLFKVKLGGNEDRAAMEAVRKAAPEPCITVDANTGWSMASLREMEPVLVDLGVELIEQPLPPGEDDALAEFECRIPLAADESCQTAADVPGLIGKYQTGVIKLDKAGGLTGAIALKDALEDAGLELMVSCMIGTSLGLAPARLIGTYCKTVDLDAAMNLKEDRDPPIICEQGKLGPTPPDLWGGS